MSKLTVIEQLIREKILVLDGAMGTMLQQRNLTAVDFGGDDLEGCNENLVLTRPDVIEDIHRIYFESGADIVETNTFGATPLVLAEYNLAHKAEEINKSAVIIAKRAAAKVGGKPRFVAASIGPTTKAISVTGGVTFQELIENFFIQTKALTEAGADLLLIETCQDTRNIKAALIAANQAFDILGKRIPIIVSGTIEPMGTMLAGQAADSLVISLAHADLFAIGLNCATGPEFMTDHVRTMHELTETYLSCYPNAGLPDEEGKYLETPESLARQLERFADNSWLNIVGGCCGTTPAHIQAIAQMVEGKKPREKKANQKGRSFYSGIELVESTNDNRPLIVGERTNVIGSRLFKNLVNEEKWDEATDIARRQVKNGAHIIDVCLQSTDRDELPDIDPFYAQIIKKIKAPFMIDTTDPLALEKSLTYSQGKSIINSINLEDGEEKFERVCPLAKKYGAALVVGTIDEDPNQAQAFTRERKLEIALRSHQLLTTKFGIREEDIIFDPLVFPCATGDENYIGGAAETIEGIRLIKKNLPNCRTTLGISNVSFGLPAQAREVVNSVFLYHCTLAGLDTAIVNAEKLERFAAIPANERKLTEDLLFNRPTADMTGVPEDWREQTKDQKAKINQHHIAAVAEHFRNAVKKETQAVSELPLDERLGQYIIQGTKDGLIPDLDLKLKEMKPLDIVNGPLMSGMSEVGRLFNANELIVAEVLQSAEAMKAAVSHLEGFMEKEDVVSKGKILLATVKGDVHDIGKNLVEIILKNNGYDVINLGIKVPPEELIKASKHHKPDIIGLSGLLVKSAQQMTITAGDLKIAGIDVPILVGGAALSEKFTVNKIAPEYAGMVRYAKDAMTGLDLANRLMDPIRCQELKNQIPISVADVSEAQKAPRVYSTTRNKDVRTDIPIPPIPYAERKMRAVPQLDEVWSFINPQMLYVRHMGFKGNFLSKLAQRDKKALELNDIIESAKDVVRPFMKVRSVWQFFEAESNGNDLNLFEAGQQVHTFPFLRQPKENGLCLSDYAIPPQNGKKDHIALFVVGAGEGIREKSEEYKNKGEYVLSHALQALAIETAEACAEWIHRRIREDWGFPDIPGMTMMERYQAKYRGKRYSFGYPACPRLEDQEGIWKLLKPQDIGVQLTEGYMMEPEASVSAIVFHHPDAAYFGVGREE